MAKKLLIWLEDSGKEDITLVGTHAHEKGTLAKLGLSIPKGFVITTQAFVLFAKSTELNGLLASEIFSYYTKLGRILENTEVTITVSSTVGKKPKKTLVVKGEANLILGIQDIWTKHLSTGDQTAPIALVVEKVITPEITIQTSPSLMNKSEVAIEAIKNGIKEQYFVDKFSGSIAAVKKSILTEDIISKLIQLVKIYEEVAYFPHQLIFGIQNGDILFLESVEDAGNSPLYKIPPQTLTTATKIYATVSTIQDIQSTSLQGVDGALSTYSPFQEISIHPKKLIQDKKSNVFEQKLAGFLEAACNSFSPRPVIYQPIDMTTHTLRKLEGGKGFEPEESNPTLGFYGALRYESDSSLFELQLNTLKKVKQQGVKNIWLVLPFIRTLDELSSMKELLVKKGIYRSFTSKVLLTVATASVVMSLDEFLGEGIDGVIVDLESLITSYFSIDLSSTEFDVQKFVTNDSMLPEIGRIVQKISRKNLPVLFLANSTLSFSLLKKLIKWGITGVIIRPGQVVQIKEDIAKIEKEIITLS